MPREMSGDCIRPGSRGAKLWYEAIELLEGINIFAAKCDYYWKGLAFSNEDSNTAQTPSPLFTQKSALKLYST